MTRVLVVDDHPVFRRGLSALLKAAGFTVIAEAASGSEAVDLALVHRPDVVMMDLGLPDLSGIAATSRITAAQPTVRVVVITLYNDPGSVRAALDAGAIGYLVKDATPEQIITAVHAAEMGARVLGPGVALPGQDAASDRTSNGGAWLISGADAEHGSGQTSRPTPGFTSELREGSLAATRFEGMTRRESSVAELIGKGLPNQVIAERLGLSSKTVANYVSIVVLKLGADDRRQAAALIRARS